jgi:hypothetical protein
MSAWPSSSREQLLAGLVVELPVPQDLLAQLQGAALGGRRLEQAVLVLDVDLASGERSGSASTTAAKPWVLPAGCRPPLR